MPGVVEFVSFKLKEGVSEEVFLKLSEAFNADFLYQQKGCLNRKLMKDGDTWADLVFWRTMEEAMAAVKAFEHSEVALAYAVCIDESSCTMQYFNVMKSY